MGDSRLSMEDFMSLCQLQINMEGSNMRTELELVELVRNMEAGRKRWLQAELELKKFKELLVKSDVAKAALEVKLKHTRNQLDLEMKKRHKVEADYHYLQRQMQLMCDILVHDTKSSACLNDEQKSLLATFDHRGANVTLQRSNRLTVIDESSFLSHSDISYDRTDDEVDLDRTMVKPLRSRARERRRSSLGPAAAGLVGKRSRGGNVSAELLERQTVEKEVGTVVQAVVTAPDARSHIHMLLGVTQGRPDKPALNVTQECTVTGEVPEEQQRQQGEEQHRGEEEVIRPETCAPCGKRIRFGKVGVKCRNCRIVAHPECKQRLTHSCSNPPTGSPTQTMPDSLEGFAPLTHPRVPRLIVDCVAEIERRGLQERGLYRVPGGQRPVRELGNRCLQGNPALILSKVQDIHVVCGVLKDFLRKLREPLVTFRLHRTFMEASELADEDGGSAIIYQAIAELPESSRDTLAFLMLHLHKVMRSPHCQMDQNNLARVFGPTIVGHGMSEPSPTTIMRDTNTQPKVICRLLSIPEDHWKQVLTIQHGPGSSGSSSSKRNQDEGHGRLFRPLTSPEMNSLHRSPSPAAVLGRIRNLGGQPEPGRRVFPSPS